MRLIREELAPRVRGMGILDGARIWERLFALTHASRDKKTLLEAIARVDCALWDVAGKALRQSVCALLGGYARRLPIISIGGYYMDGQTLADIGREMKAYRKAGMAGCKFKVGGLTPEQDAERVETARRAVGPDFVLALDANRGWSVPEAARFARLVEPLGIRWFEEPCHWHDDVAMMARVRRATGIPITAVRARSPVTAYAAWSRAAPSTTSTPRRVEASPRGGARPRCAVWPGADGASRGVADRPAAAGGGAARHLRRVLYGPRVGSGVAYDMGEPSGQQGWCAQGDVAPPFRPPPNASSPLAPRLKVGYRHHDAAPDRLAWSSARKTRCRKVLESAFGVPTFVLHIIAEKWGDKVDHVGLPGRASCPDCRPRSSTWSPPP